MPDPTPAEIDTGATALNGPLVRYGAVQQGYRRTVAEAVLRAVLPGHDARLRAEIAEQWRAAYDAKVVDFARETAKLARLVTAVVADGQRNDALTRHNQSCGVCVALREATEDAHTTGGDHG